MEKEQFEQLCNLTDDLNLIKRIAGESNYYTIKFIIEFMSSHRSFNSEQILYFINIVTGCYDQRKQEVLQNIILNNSYTPEELKSIVDRIDSINNIKRYDSRVEALRNSRVGLVLNKDEFMRLLDSSDEEILEKTRTIEQLIKDNEMNHELSLEELHSSISKILDYKKENKKKDFSNKKYVEVVDQEDRNNVIRENIKRYAISTGCKEFSILLDIKLNLEKITDFDKLWSIENIISLYERNGKKLDINQIKLLVSANSGFSNYTASRVNSFFENLDVMKNRSFDEILEMIQFCLSTRFFGDCFDVENLVLNPLILSTRTHKEVMFLAHQLEKYADTDPSFIALKSLYELALTTDVDFETIRKEFELVKNLESDSDKECASIIFRNFKYLGGDVFEKAVQYIKEVVKCDTPAKKRALTEAARFIESNKELSEQEKIVLAKMIRKAQNDIEATSISEIVIDSKNLSFNDQLDLIDLSTSSYSYHIIDAQNNLKCSRGIQEASSIEEIKEVFDIVPKRKNSFHF